MSPDGSESETETLAAARRAAARLLALRDRSTAELRERLGARFPASVVCEVVDELAGAGYLDDRRLASRLVDTLVTERRFGPRRIRQELTRRGLPAEAAEGLLEPYGEDWARGNALAVSRAYLKGAADRPEDKVLRRLSGYLGRRGFSAGIIRDMVHLARQGRLWDEP